MKTAKVFLNGRSQAIRLPKEYRFEGGEVYIKKINNFVLLIPKDDPWAPLIDSLEMFSDDYLEKREQPDLQNRSSK